MNIYEGMKTVHTQEDGGQFPLSQASLLLYNHLLLGFLTSPPIEHHHLFATSASIAFCKSHSHINSPSIIKHDRQYFLQHIW